MWKTGNLSVFHHNYFFFVGKPKNIINHPKFEAQEVPKFKAINIQKYIKLRRIKYRTQMHPHQSILADNS